MMSDEMLRMQAEEKKIQLIGSYVFWVCITAILCSLILVIGPYMVRKMETRSNARHLQEFMRESGLKSP